jgi:DNA-binding LacI/PurR family transcriptional regulator
MARMRNIEVRDASSLPPVRKSSPPRKTGDQLIQDKHAKWRRQILLAKRREEEQKQQKRQKQRQQQQAPGCVVDPRSQPGKILEQLLRSAACGVDLDDSSNSYGDFSSSDSSEERVAHQKIENVIRRNRKLASPSSDGRSEARAEALQLEGQAELSSSLVSEHSSQAVSVTDKNFIKAFIHVSQQEYASSVCDVVIQNQQVSDIDFIHLNHRRPPMKEFP